MPSSLTRAVFQQIVNGKPIHHTGCLAPRPTPLRKALAPSCLTPGSRRSFWAAEFFRRSKERNASPNLEPGVKKLMEHDKRLTTRARLNSPEEIYKALEEFVKTQMQKPKGSKLQDLQIRLVERAYVYIRGQDAVSPPALFYRQLAGVLSKGNTEYQAHPSIQSTNRARLAWLLQLDSGNDPAGSENLAEVLAIFGYPEKARELVFASLTGQQVGFEELRTAELRGLGPATRELDAPDWTALRPEMNHFERVRALGHCVRAFIAQGRESEVHATIERAATHITKAGPMILERAVCNHYALIGNDQKAREWFYRLSHDCWPIVRDPSDRNIGFASPLFEQLVHVAIRLDDLDFGNRVLAVIPEIDATEELRHNLSLLLAAGTGEGTDKIAAALDERVSSNLPIDHQTINGMISAALEQNDPSRAEDLYRLGKAHNVAFDAQTYLLRVDYLLNGNDLDGALSEFNTLQNETTPDPGQIDQSVNRLVRALCATKRHRFETIMDVVAAMTDLRAEFEAETVSTLAILHLSRSEMEDAEDLLNTYTFQFSIAERQSLISALTAFCTDPSTETNTMEETYELMRQVFDEMTREQRLPLVLELLRRGASQSAVHAFEQMKLTMRDDTIPTTETYIAAFDVIADAGDIEAFGKLYNMLKLDTDTEPTTALSNSLMAACLRCGMSERAVTLWDALVKQPTGPDLHSVFLVYQACRGLSRGDIKAIQIHRRLEQGGLRLTKPYLSWLLSALGEHGRIDASLGMMARWEAENGLAPNVEMIGALLNSSPSREAQEVVLEWARGKAPAAAEHLESNIVGKTPTGILKFSGAPE